MNEHYSWYISFYYRKNSGVNGFGANCIIAPNRMETTDDIRDMTEYIKESHVGIDDVIILFWKPLKTDGGDRNE